MSNSIIRLWLAYDELKKNLKKSALGDFERKLERFNKVKSKLAQSIISLDAQWPMEIKHTESAFPTNTHTQNTIDFSREIFILRQKIDGKIIEKRLKLKPNQSSEDFYKILAKFFKKFVQQSNPSQNCDPHAIFTRAERFLSRTNIGVVSYRNAALIHEIEVIGPMRQKLEIAKAMTKVRVIPAGPPGEAFENELRNLPVLKHINQSESVVEIFFEEKRVSICTTSYFKSFELQKSSVGDSAYKYFAAYVESFVYFGDRVEEEGRLLVFSQKSPIFN